MDKYFYFVSQLPALVFDREPGLSVEAFLEEAGKWLSAGDLKTLKSVSLFDSDVSKKGPAALKSIQAFEGRFRRELAAWRKAHHDGQEMKTYEFPPAMVREGNPLEVEKKLLSWRWHFIEEMESDHHFDLEWLVLYFLKLQILQRLVRFDKEKGLENFRELVSVDPLAADVNP